jgi:hypothetical protein
MESILGVGFKVNALNYLFFLAFRDCILRLRKTY